MAARRATSGRDTRKGKLGSCAVVWCAVWGGRTSRGKMPVTIAVMAQQLWQLVSSPCGQCVQAKLKTPPRLVLSYHSTVMLHLPVRTKLTARQYKRAAYVHQGLHDTTSTSMYVLPDNWKESQETGGLTVLERLISAELRFRRFGEAPMRQQHHRPRGSPFAKNIGDYNHFGVARRPLCLIVSIEPEGWHEHLSREKYQKLNDRHCMLFQRHLSDTGKLPLL